MTTLTQQLEDKKKGCGTYLYDSDFEDLQDLFEHRVDCGVQEVITGEMQYCKTCRAEIAILEQAIAEMQKRDKDIDELAESSTFALCALMKENKELKDEMQKQRQEILDKIIEVKKEILLQRRYLPSKEYIGTMNYWVGDNNENRGIYVDLGGIIGKIDDFIEQLNQPKTEHEHENQHI